MNSVLLNNASSTITSYSISLASLLQAKVELQLKCISQISLPEEDPMKKERTPTKSEVYSNQNITCSLFDNWLVLRVGRLDVRTVRRSNSLVSHPFLRVLMCFHSWECSQSPFTFLGIDGRSYFKDILGLVLSCYQFLRPFIDPQQMSIDPGFLVSHV